MSGVTGWILTSVQRQTANDLTGEHTCVMLRPLKEEADQTWLGAFSNDFHRRFLSLLAYKFREFPSILALTIEDSASAGAQLDPSSESVEISKADLDKLLSPFDHKRLESYANGMLDYHVVLDLIPVISQLYFAGRLKSNVKLNSLQQAILLAIGLQHKDVDPVAAELNVPPSQLLATFMKIVRKIVSHMTSLVSEEIEASMPDARAIGVNPENASAAHDDELIDNKFVPLEMNLDDELEEGGDEAIRELRQKQRELIDSLPLDQ
jgi:N-acetyltransferase 10